MADGQETKSESKEPKRVSKRSEAKENQTRASAGKAELDRGEK
jgi:hypothetical protein